MKKNITGKAMIAVLTGVLILFSSINTFAQKANFSGEWKLNESKSELGQFGGWTARTVKAEQKDDAMVIVRTTPGFNGGDPVTTTITLTFDGKVVESEGFGGAKRKSTAKWSDDGQTLTVNSTTNFERDGQSFELKSTESWTLKDGMLTIATNTSSPRGEMATKAVYSK